MTKSAVHLQASIDPSPRAVFAALNTPLNDMADRRMFVTAACALMDGGRGQIKVSTAGHPPVLVRHEAGITALRTPSLALGMKQDARFEEASFSASPGDAVLLYSDGVLERADSAGVQYGQANLEATFEANAHRPVSALITAIVEQNDAFGNHSARTDDITVLAARLP
jgi:sigma-B regulation protein RsbU (phosphoserine phosphatase)